MLILLTSSAFAATRYAYIGGDLSYSQTNFKQGYGLNIFSQKPSAQINLFGGYYFAQLLGFECGYEQNFTRKTTVTVPAAVSEFGIANFTGLASNAYDTKKSLSGWNINYVPRFYLTPVVSLIPVIGFAYIKTKDDLDLILFDGASATPQEQNNYNVNFVVAKIVPRLGLRLQYLINNYVGIRASYIWENTALLQPTTTRNINLNQTLQAKLTNTSAVGVGMLFKF